MPNGFYGSLEEWQRMEAPFLEIDEVLEEFAADRKMHVEKNYHNLPRRELEWVHDDIYRSISIFQGDPPETCCMAVCAWQDRQNERYAANKWVKRSVPWPEITDNLQQLLDEAVEILDSWSETDLKWSTTISPNVGRS